MKNNSIFQSFKKAYEGFLYIYQTHFHFRLNIFIGGLIIILSIIFRFQPIELVLIILAVILIFFSETLNTSIEEICNLITEEYHPKIKAIKDLGSFLVLLAVIFSLSIFITIFLKNIIKYASTFI